MPTENRLYRHELKYICNEAQLRHLQVRIKDLMPADVNAGQGGSYRVRSLYFDDVFNTCYYENMNGTDPREKFRIRIYNSSAGRIQLEQKRKERGKTLKDACGLTIEQCTLLMNGRPPALGAETPPVLRRLILLMHTRLYRPRVIVDYERWPYVCPLGNVRITFDRNISSAAAGGEMFSPGLPLRPVMPAGQHILEVKFDEYLPDYIYNALQIGHQRQTAFSKYYLCRKYALGEYSAAGVKAAMSRE